MGLTNWCIHCSNPVMPESSQRPQQQAAAGEMLSVDAAIPIIDAVPVQPRIVRKHLRHALGTRLAADVAADRDYPPFDKSRMDGYAVRSVDVAHAPVELAVVGEVAAGQWHNRMLEPGQCVAIMTGAPLPPGADGVVPIEEVQ